MFKSVNKAIKILIASEMALNGAWGLLGPVFAIFIVQNIATGNPTEGAKVAGFASLVYWVVKSFLQIPIGKYLDKNHGEKDDFIFVVFGTFLTGLVPFGYLFSNLPWHIYLLQVLEAMGMAMAIPSWSAIFTRHIDKGKEAFEWGLNSTSLGLACGIAGAIGGISVATFGFKIIFVLTGIFTIVSAILLIFIRKEITPTNEKVSHYPPFSTPF